MSLPDDLKDYKARRRFDKPRWYWSPVVAAIVAYGFVQGLEDKTELRLADEAREERRVYEAPHLLHPLSCEGTWVRKCADFEGCETICRPE